ncbi:MAG: DUF1501 domain-containing protein [Sphingobacteriales bacterium]|nr:MAG: DUF1501 domain-containing protein [Sphingobacteriales bacterium]
MNRKTFLQNASLLSIPLVLKGLPVFAGNTLNHPWLQSLAKTANSCGKVLVIIQLNGGNDGLNMVIPLDKMSELNTARPGLYIPAANTLSLTNNATTGLHPAMSGLQSLYNSGKATIIQGVTYSNPSYSHFTAQDIWFSSPATSATTVDTGWMGRSLDQTYPGYPNGYPNTTAQDPLAIQIGGSLPLMLQGGNVNMAYNVPSNAALTSVATGSAAPAPASDYGTELTFVRLMQQQSNAYQSRISAAYTATNGFSHSALYTTASGSGYTIASNSLADQLKTVARLIGGGLTTQVYVVNHPDSFDTHVNQNASGSVTTGSHANSLARLSNAIAGFMADIQTMGKQNLVAGMTFSEFGRRIISNTSQGTDHGAGAPVLLFGAMLNGGMVGTSPNLPTTPTASSQVPLQHDFRQLYASILQEWMCVSASDSQSILNTSSTTNTPLGLFRTTQLPVEGIELTATWQGHLAQVDFMAYNNSHFDRFAVERSTDGRDFERVGLMRRIDSQLSAQPYRYTEGRIDAPTVFYRVVGLGYQNPVYSRTVELTNGARAQAVQMYPNPATDFTVYVDFLKDVQGMVAIELYDMRGSRIFMDTRTPQNRRLKLVFPDMFGTYTPYILRVQWESEDVREQILFV